MTVETTESLTDQFKALHAERERSWDPAKLAKNVEQRRALVDAFNPDNVIKIGDTVAPFELIDSAGGTITLEALTATGPAVLIFFRYAGCPACNIALPYYDRELRPALDAVGIQLVAVSPQLPERVGEIRTRHGLGFRVASDPDNRLGRRFGITFGADSVPESPPVAGWIGELTGTGTAELPQPTVILIDSDRKVRFVAVSPDWLVRAEAPEILAAVEALNFKVAA